MSANSPKRQKLDNQEKDQTGVDIYAVDDYVPYVPVKKRREQQIATLAGGRHAVSLSRRREDDDEYEADDDDKRKNKKKGKERGGDEDNGISDDESESELAKARRAREERRQAGAASLFTEAQESKRLKAEQDANKTELEKKAEEEAAALKAISATQTRLAGAKELAMGVLYTEPLKTTWTAPRYILDQSESETEKLREKLRVMVESEPGDSVPSPINDFTSMKIPQPLVDYFKNEKNIKSPTPIQAQGIPIAFSGRDMIGVAYTGSGKTLAFLVPMLMFALEEERKLPFIGGEGPIGIVLCPSRELARQTYETLVAMTEVMARAGYPHVGTLLCIGQISMADQSHSLRKGFHMVVATPGRLQDMLSKKQFNLNICKYLCLDEADRMIDAGFEDDLRNILSFFTRQRQTLLFSATMPTKIRDFAKQSLIKPILLNVGRAGTASLNIIQEVEYVKEEAKMVYLLECLQKTPPPVIIFSDNKNEVDDIQEYLLLKGVEAVSIHGSKSQAERDYAIKSFKKGDSEVMVANGVAAKGLDFEGIQHVINFSMPRDVEDYVHQIGRTGRSGKTGMATTFVNMDTPEDALLHLKYMLIEAKQRVPPFLAAVEDPNANQPGLQCNFCGAFGHSILKCPRQIENQRRAVAATMRGGEGGY